MTRDEFLREVAEVLMIDRQALQPAVELSAFETWDSTTVLNLMVMLDERGFEVDQDKVPDCRTVQDIIDLVSDRFD